jgi:hypothetical protein
MDRQPHPAAHRHAVDQRHIGLREAKIWAVEPVFVAESAVAVQRGPS